MGTEEAIDLILTLPPGSMWREALAASARRASAEDARVNRERAKLAAKALSGTEWEAV